MKTFMLHQKLFFSESSKSKRIGEKKNYPFRGNINQDQPRVTTHLYWYTSTIWSSITQNFKQRKTGKRLTGKD
jgi:hypothetical protein